MVCGHTLGEHIFVAHFSAALDVIGFLDAKESALLPRPVIGLCFIVGGDTLGLNREIATPHRGVGADKNILGHGRGGFDRGVDAVPTRRTARNETQPRRIGVVILFLGQRFITCRPRVRAVAQWVVIEARFHIARRTGQGRGGCRQHRGPHITPGRDRGFENTVGIFLIGGHFIGSDRTIGILDRFVQVSDANDTRISTCVQAQQVNAVLGLIVDIHAGIAIKGTDHATARVDDRPHQLDQATLHIGRCHLQALGACVIEDDRLIASLRHGGQRIGTLGGVDGQVLELLVDFCFAVGWQWT